MNNRLKAIVKTHLLTILTLVGVVLSIVVGIIMRSFDTTYTPRTVMYVNFLGDLFLRMIRALILPLIISSLIAAIAPLDIGLSKKIGARAIVYILLTTVVAVLIGLALVLSTRPGDEKTSESARPPNTKSSNIVDTILDLIRNMFPPNIVQATLSTYTTVLTPPVNDSNAHINDYKISGTYVDGTNMIGVVAIAVIEIDDI